MAMLSHPAWLQLGLELSSIKCVLCCRHVAYHLAALHVCPSDMSKRMSHLALDSSISMLPHFTIPAWHVGPEQDAFAHGDSDPEQPLLFTESESESESERRTSVSSMDVDTPLPCSPMTNTVSQAADPVLSHDDQAAPIASIAVVPRGSPAPSPASSVSSASIKPTNNIAAKPVKQTSMHARDSILFLQLEAFTHGSRRSVRSKSHGEAGLKVVNAYRPFKQILSTTPKPWMNPF